MEEQLREQVADSSLIFETSGDNLASLSFIEKYDRFLQNDHAEADSDGDFLPDDSVLREEFARLRNGAENQSSLTDGDRLSLGIPSQFRSPIEPNLSPAEGSSAPNRETSEVRGNKSTKSEPTTLNELIEKLNAVRRCGQDGNSIFCTPEELEQIQERYKGILDYLHERRAIFQKVSHSRHSDGHRDHENDRDDDDEDVDTEDEEVEVKETESPAPKPQDEDLRQLRERIESVENARDKFYEVEQQVKDQLDQLELVERYKMESVG